MRILSIGEILWDVIGENEYLGGAPLNFAAHARRLGHEVFLLSAVGDDDRGRRALDGLRRFGISTDLVQVPAGQKTGTAQVELDSEGKPEFRIVHPAAYDFVDLDPEQIKRIADLQPDWIYFGTLYHMTGQALASTLKVLKAVPSARRFYDVNLREGHWSLSVVEQLSAQASVIKLSGSETEFLDGSVNAENENGSAETFCRRWRKQYPCDTICVTFGERGCAIFHDNRYCDVPGYKIEVSDTVGAGDAFAAAFLHAIEQGWGAQHAGMFANAVGALVASRHGAIPAWTVEEAVAL